jgi:hypothetical protein
MIISPNILNEIDTEAYILWSTKAPEPHSDSPQATSYRPVKDKETLRSQPRVFVWRLLMIVASGMIALLSTVTSLGATNYDVIHWSLRRLPIIRILKEGTRAPVRTLNLLQSHDFV